MENISKIIFSYFLILIFLDHSSSTQQSLDLDLTSAIGEAYHKFHEEDMILEGSPPQPQGGSRCSFFHSRTHRKGSNRTSATPPSLRVHRDAKIFKNLVNIVMNFTKEEDYSAGHHLTKDLLETALEEDKSLVSMLERHGGLLLSLRSRPKVGCDPEYRYRSMDGTCNSLIYTEYGSQGRPFHRSLQPQYQDGHDVPRGGRCPSSLPNPRHISTTAHPDRDISNNQVTNMVMQFGQFLAHDMSAIAETEPHEDCCSHGCSSATSDCFQIQIPSKDSFYSSLIHPQTCLSFSRSASTISTAPYREQFNINTGFLDAGMVYGSSPVTHSLLRAFSGGELIWNRRDRSFLPTVEDVYPGDLTEFPELPDHPDPVFPGEYFAGDLRVNDMPGLSTMHTLWFREHNRLAAQVKARLPASLQTDEFVFQEARRVLTSVWQNVIYNEHLPVILGPELMDKYQLDVSEGYSNYDHNLNYQENLMINAFSTAAYRFGHSLVQGNFHLYAGGYQFDSYNFFEHFFDSANMTMLNYNFIMEGLINQPAQQNDEFVTSGLSNFLFKEPENNFGEDLLARNIQRGRDHGLPPYHRYRILAGLTPLPATFTYSNNPPEMTRAAWSKLSQAYKSPQDIDLFPGGLSEIGVVGGQMGPTFGFIVAQQFYLLKITDRFFYTHANSESRPWGKQALLEIRGHKLANVICDNTDIAATADWVQRMPTNGEGSDNPVKPCSRRKGMDLDIIVRDILKDVSL